MSDNRWWQMAVLAVVTLLAWNLVKGAPYVPTRQKDLDILLKLIALRPGQTLIDLGSGDGRVLAAVAAKGVRGIGYEINLLMALFSRYKLRRYGHLVKIRWGNAERLAELKKADAIYIFQSRRFMKLWQEKIRHNVKKGTRIISYGFVFPDLKVTSREGPFIVYDL